MTLLVNLQDLLCFRVTVGLSIFRNMIFVSLCRLDSEEQELILIRGTVMKNERITIVPRKLRRQQ